MSRVRCFKSVSLFYPVAFVLRSRALVPLCAVVAVFLFHGCSRDTGVTVTQLEDPAGDAPRTVGTEPVFTLRLPASPDDAGHLASLPFSRKRNRERPFAYFLEIEHRNPTFEYFARNSEQEIMTAMDEHLRAGFTYSDLFDGKGALRDDRALREKLSTHLAAKLFTSFRKVSPQDPLLVSVRMEVVRAPESSRPDTKQQERERIPGEEGQRERSPRGEDLAPARVASPSSADEKLSLRELDEKLQTGTVTEPIDPPVAPPQPLAAGEPPTGGPPPAPGPGDAPPTTGKVIDNPYR